MMHLKCTTDWYSNFLHVQCMCVRVPTHIIYCMHWYFRWYNSPRSKDLNFSTADKLMKYMCTRISPQHDSNVYSISVYVCCDCACVCVYVCPLCLCWVPLLHSFPPPTRSSFTLVFFVSSPFSFVCVHLSSPVSTHTLVSTLLPAQYENML